METPTQIQDSKKYNKWIVILSIIVPVLVAILFTVKIPNVAPLTFLPPIYATTNGFTAILLILAIRAIKKGDRKMHERYIKIAILFSVLFLAMYVAYHMTSESTKYGGSLGLVYYPILISHILLSIVVIPFVLITYVRGITNQIVLHKKIAKYTFPLWLYVAVTGVIVYVMIFPYY